jgi:hypothetical protein
VVNIELRLIATMLYTGNFSPILQGDITAEHFQTESGKILFNFITTYRSESDGSARFPSLSIVRHRFSKSAIELPDPDPGDSLNALVYETILQRVRGEMQSVANDLQVLSEGSGDPVVSLPRAVAQLRKLTERVQRSKHTSLAEGFMDVVADYDAGNILPMGMPYPWPSMTKATRGLHQKEVVLIAGRPKSRKSFTAFSIGAYAMTHHHARVLVFTPEMPKRQVLLRFIAFVCKLRYAEFKDAALDAAEEVRLLEAARKYSRLEADTDEQYVLRLRSMVPGIPEGALPSIDIIESAGKSVDWIESQIELHHPDLVISDSFYKQATGIGRSAADAKDWKVVSALSNAYKELAMNTGVRMIVTYQMNREAEGKIGSLANLSLADAVGQDIDVGLRVITGKMEGQERSALVNLGSREVPFDGILINNVPCCDFSEIGPITSRKTVESLMNQEDENAAKEDAERARKSGTISSNKSYKSAVEKTRAKVNDDFAVPGEDSVPAQEAVSEGEQLS